ncbi:MULTISPECIES: ribonuclease P protein component [Arthrobacter]|uniref:Ribonuclease P protein component n=2 Tax=Arthrobacter TaxID=1663 RepID=A0ABU9KL93_9MICC|nr:ribonuclease P protein component [Arthrobacter sp. YJM1]MDP5226872.1 ribonuclease P protein component [Arthrobacter sp. YJM1]
MLPAPNRLRLPADFSTTLRSGVRVGRRNLVLSAHLSPGGTRSRIGFIVSKAVGNAVTRNLVKRRLREIGARLLTDHPTGVDVVVRALPAAAQSEWEELVTETEQAFAQALRRLAARAAGKQQPGPERPAASGERT